MNNEHENEDYDFPPPVSCECPIRCAILDNDRALAMHLIAEGHDPFKPSSSIMDNRDDTTAFHEASALGDLGLLLAMAGEPGVPLVERFLVCCSKIVAVPTKGRDCIRSLDSSRCSGNLFRVPRTVSMEGIEVAVMYGYILKPRDLEYSMIPEATAGDPRKIQMLKFGFAIGCGEALRLEQRLERWLDAAVDGEYTSFANGWHRISPEPVRMLLKIGANANGYSCFPGGMAPYNFASPLFQALQNRDADMAQLLVAYGADLSPQDAQFSSWTEDHAGRIIETVSIQLVEEVGMTELLTIPAEDIITADPDAYFKEIRHELTAPLRHCVAEYSAILTVAMMRMTGSPAPPGMFSEIILDYCPLGFDLWPTIS
jgi:hypothetical protein